MRLLITAAFVATASFAAAQNAYFTGTMSASDPTWNRPIETGTSLSGVGTSVHFDVQPFFVAANGTFTFETLPRRPITTTPLSSFIKTRSTPRRRS